MKQHITQKQLEKKQKICKVILPKQTSGMKEFNKMYRELMALIKI